MSDRLTTIENTEILLCSIEGTKLTGEQDALDLIGESLRCAVETIVVPVERLDERFFQLQTGLAGQIMQKCVNYRRRLVILGDISSYLAQSRSLRDFVFETNRGNQIWFLRDLQELRQRLICP